MKKVLSIILVVVMIFAFTACKDNNKKAKWTIGICQLTQHEALDKATKGFIDEVKKQLGDEVEILEQNAGGDFSNCTTIVNGFISRKVNLILANATPALQAAAESTKDIPILGTSVTDYSSALSIDNFSGVCGGNISGTSDLAPLDKQADMIKEWFPDCKKVAILYCSSEANSIFQSKEIAKHISNLGMESKEFTFTDSNDVASVTGLACSWADVIYIPTDNTAASNAEGIGNVVFERNIPVISGEMGICHGCGIATLSFDYYDLGVATGKMAVEILKNGKDISTMPIEYVSEFTKYYNPLACEKFGLTVLSGYEELK